MLFKHARHALQTGTGLSRFQYGLLLHKLLLHLAASLLTYCRGRFRDAALLADANAFDVAKEVEDQRALLSLLQALAGDVVDAFVNCDLLEPRNANKDLAGSGSEFRIVEEDGADDSSKFLLELDKVGLVERGYTGFQDIGADEFSDGRREGCVLRDEVRDKGAENSKNDSTASAIAHPNGMGEEHKQRLEDC